MICCACKMEIKIQKGTEIPYRDQLVNTIINLCISKLQSGKCEAGGAHSGCKENNCKFKPLYLKKKLNAAGKKELRQRLQEHLEKVVIVKSHQPYCSKGTFIFCISCGIKARTIRNGDEISWTV